MRYDSGVSWQSAVSKSYKHDNDASASIKGEKFIIHPIYFLFVKDKLPDGFIS
jgi:hypothetical protein